MSLLDDFLVRAGVAGVAAALAAGPLGCFVVWRRMAYFGDAIAHAAILGVAMSLALEIPVFAGVLAVAAAAAAGVSLASGRSYAADTLLGVAAHTALAGGLVAMAFLPGARLDLMGYLFGDILAVSRADLWTIVGGAAAALALLAWRWTGLLSATLSPDLAAAEGRDPDRERLILMLALAFLVAAALKVVGALLITALLVIPAAAARAVSPTPERMAAAAALIGAASVLGGLGASWTWDAPAGPSVVLAASGLLALANLAVGLRRAARR
ncbi:iron chelate uptake ABC transporter family permease subunit [Albimonas sp. CAU 1670]|uniref:iron chelate uptake ABC transporter family permease subunit n=1 Tax=Albimonas sp. CAU 1670 TaxID=3032599 RepID=UPI0023DB5679|nr:iron chelate uptake ABC transporter family permease subunit [Albimonas sp. CAU 1670]MDF2231965.1 iron chelate uptake ABC transporter family permease subunit [Albimonas sp. CAU 1670]